MELLARMAQKGKDMATPGSITGNLPPRNASSWRTIHHASSRRAFTYSSPKTVSNNGLICVIKQAFTVYVYTRTELLYTTVSLVVSAPWETTHV